MSTSSFVAAGVLQATLPVLVENVSSLARSTRSRHDSSRSSHIISRYARKFRIELKIYQDTFTKLLEDVASSDMEVRRMIENLEHPSWRNERLQKNFEDRFLDTYDRLDEIVAKLNQDIKNLSTRLDLSSSAVKSDSGSKLTTLDVFGDVLPRELDQVFERLREFNNCLSSAARPNASLESQGRRNSTSRYTASLKSLRRHVDAVNKSLAHATCQNSGCKYCRNLNFRLQPVRSESGYLNQDLLFGFRSDISSRQQDRSSPMIPPLRIHPQSNKRKNTVKEHSLPCSNMPGTNSAGRVKFRDIELVNEPYRPITNLCNDLAQLSQMSSDNTDPMTLGAIEGQNSEWRYSVTSMRDAIPELHNAIPLSDLLQSHNLRSSAVRSALSPSGKLEARKPLSIAPSFSPGDKYELAATIALGTVLFEGVWMQSDWDSSDVLVTRRAVDDDDNDDEEKERVVCELCFSRDPKLAGKQIEQSPDAVQAEDAGSPNVLLRLAMALIEISDGRSFDCIQTPEEREDGVTGIRGTAMRMLPNLAQSSGPRYSDVVRRCIVCPFGVSTYSLDNEQFFNQVFVHVVKPLVEDCEWYNRF